VKRLPPAALALLSAFLFGASTPVSKALLAQVEPFTLAGLLYLGAAAGLVPVLLGTRQWPRLDRRSLVRLGGAIAAGGVCGPVLLLFGLRLAPASTVSLWLNLETVATAGLAVLFFREDLSRLGWLANAGVFASGLLLSFQGSQVALGGLLVAGACLCWGIDNNLTSTIDGLSPAQSTFCKGLAAGTVNLGIGLQAAGGSLPHGGTLAVALVTGSLSYGASIALYVAAAQKLGAARSQMLFASAPVWGVLGSILALGEGLTPLQAGAAGLLAVALAVLFRDRHEHEHQHRAMEHTHAHDHLDGHHVHEHPGLDPALMHTHWHRHEPLTHAHRHWPDLHHRHGH
jgi:drug/metabolite transporter (DMT)-like permease